MHFITVSSSYRDCLDNELLKKYNLVVSTHVLIYNILIIFITVQSSFRDCLDNDLLKKIQSYQLIFLIHFITVQSSFRDCLDNDLLKKYNLIIPTDVFPPDRQIGLNAPSGLFRNIYWYIILYVFNFLINLFLVRLQKYILLFFSFLNNIVFAYYLSFIIQG